MSDTERGYTITRTFDAPRDLVWEAWTRPEHFAVWFGTAATPMEDVVLDVRPEGRWSGTMLLPDGAKIFWRGVYREVIEPERLVLDITDGSGGHLEDVYDRFTVTLVAKGDATEMTLRQSGGHLSDEEYERAKIGTDSFLDTMEELLGDQLKMRHET